MTIQVLKINQGTKFEIWLFFHCLKLLFNVLPVPVRKVRKYGQVRKQGSNSVALWHGFYGAQVQLHMIFLAHNQKSSRLCDQLVVSFEPCLVLKPNRVALTELPGSSVHSNN